MLNCSTAPPQISTFWGTHYQRMMDHMRDGVWGDLRKWKASDEGSRGKLMEQEKKNINDSVRGIEWGNTLHSLNKKGERWQHFTCWRMKVFIVAKMRATLQKQHRDTTVTQPGSTSTSDDHIPPRHTGSHLVSLVNCVLTLNTPSTAQTLFTLFSPLGDLIYLNLFNDAI